MSKRHTSGPWECTDIVLDAHDFDDESSKVVLVRSRRGDIAYAAHFATNGDPAEQYANAKLIAAAPELLAAAQAAWNCIGELPPTQARVEVGQMLSAAIAKATE